MISEELNVSRIIGLHAENTMRLKAVDLTPPEHLVVVAGDNEQGKSSLLHSIEMALAGADAFPEMPVRKGQKRAVVDIDLGDLKVHRTISANGSTTLTVRARDGTALDTPQKILDALRGKRSFDPMEFMRLKPEKQAETLRQISGLDTTALDSQYKQLYDERTLANRELAQKKAKLDGMPARHADAPEVEQSMADAAAEHTKAVQANSVNADQRKTLEDMKARLSEFQQGTTRAKNELPAKLKNIERLKQLLAQAEEDHKKAEDEIETRVLFQAESEKCIENQKERCNALVDVDLGPITARINGLELANRKCRENKARKDAEAACREASTVSEALSRKLNAIETQKSDLIQGAKYPVPGLGFTDAGTVSYNGVPFEQASTSVQLKVSVAIGLALNPKLRILCIRNGNDLDQKSLALLAEMAREHHAQIWLERVEKTGEVAVIIEDGNAIVPKSKEQPSLV